MNATPTSDEKVMAALAHGSVFLAFLGPVVPVLVWASQRKKSNYIRFHALQAMGYQALTFWLWIVAMILIMVLALCLAIPFGMAITENADNARLFPFVFQMFIFIAIFGFMGLFFITGIVAAGYCLSGRDFRYPLIGKWLERRLPYSAGLESEMDETREDNWVAGICHATAILQLWGVVTPLIVWFTQKERSARLRFQAMQAFVYQLAALVAYLVGMALYMVGFFGMFFAVAAAGMANKGEQIEGPVAGIMLVFFGLIMIFWLIFMILMPVYYLLAGFASIRNIQGRLFRYPIIGRILEKRMQTSQQLEATT